MNRNLSGRAIGRLSRRDLGAGIVAGTVLVLLPVRSLGLGGVDSLTPGVALSLLIAPVWMPVLFSTVWLRRLEILTILALLSGIALYLSNPTRSDNLVAIGVMGTLVRFALTVAVVRWSLELLHFRTVVSAVAGGHLLQALLWPSQTDLALYWKYELAWPVTALSLAVISKFGPTAQAGTGLLLLAADVASGYRSHGVFMVLALALWLVDRTSTRTGRPFEAAQPVGRRSRRLFAGALAVPVVYWAASHALVAGWLGEDARRRTLAQTAAGGDVLTSGRVEPVVALALFRENPLGFGPGFTPGIREMSAARDSLVSAGHVVNEYYLQSFMFDGQIKLHSLFGDLWVNFGLPGLALWFYLLILIGSVGLSCRLGNLPLLFSVLLVWSCWDLLFSPMYSNLGYFGVALATLAWTAEVRVGSADRPPPLASANGRAVPG